MNPIAKKVNNKRLSLELNLHVISPMITMNLDEKTIQGQIQSFKSDKVTDAIGKTGQLHPAAVTGFQIVDADLSNPETAVVNYVTENIDLLVSN